MACVPSCSGTKSSFSFSVTTAFALLSRLMSETLPIGPTDLHGVAGHELARVLEDRLYLVAVTPAEHRERERSATARPHERRPESHHSGRAPIRAHSGGRISKVRASLPVRFQAQPSDLRLPRRQYFTVPGLREESQEATPSPAGPWASPERNCRTNWLSELNSSLGRSRLHDPALPEDRDVVGDAAPDMMSWVMTHVGAAVLGVDLLDQLAQERGAHRIEAGVGLVEEHDVRVEHERPGEPGPLAHPPESSFGILSRAPEPDLLEPPVDDLA